MDRGGHLQMRLMVRKLVMNSSLIKLLQNNRSWRMIFTMYNYII